MPSDDVVISVRNVSKNYRLFAHPGDRIKQFLTFGLKKFHQEFTALEDISFEVRRGETVGIIGRNGAGKSTLLQLICGIVKPTRGAIEVNGRVSALLELGAGFNPEFTGRENVYFQGSLMSFSKAQMDERFDAIKAFADIGEFVDQPVRMYSSGMFVRLAFAVAVSLEPDILVVDEALAVGDAGFRARCYKRIGELRIRGCTVLFVSHDFEQIERLSHRVLLLSAGRQLSLGAPKREVNRLRSMLTSAVRAEPNCTGQPKEKFPGLVDAALDFPQTRVMLADRKSNPSREQYVPNGAVVETVELLNAAGESVSLLAGNQIYRCLVRTRFVEEASFVRFGMLLKSHDGFRLGGTMSAVTLEKGITNVGAGEVVLAEFKFRCILSPGEYLISVATFAGVGGVEYALHGIEDALRISVESCDTSAIIGAVDLGISTRVSAIREGSVCV